MAKIKVKGYEIITTVIKESFNRRALQFKNNIIDTLGKIGVNEYNTNIPIETFAIKKAQASVSWYFDGHHLYYSYNGCNNFVENLYVVYKIIEIEVNALLNKEKTSQEFILEFSESKEVEEERKKARELLGVSEDSLDLELINTKYKALAKEYHPDMPTGDAEKFKAINHAHKLLKRELQ